MNIFTILFLCEDKDIGRFSNLHLCTFNAQPLFIFIIIIVLLLLHYYHNYYYYYPFISGSSSSSSSSIRTSSSIIIIIIIISSSSINNISESIPVLTSICEHFMCFLLFYINALVPVVLPPFLKDYNGNKVTQIFCAIPAIAHFFYHGLNFNEFIFA